MGTASPDESASTGDVPDITVELGGRRSVDRPAAVAGALAGAAVGGAGAVGAVGVVGAIGFPVGLDAMTRLVVLGFNCTYALAFGTLFGLLVDTRSAWRYGRGFLGPLVGAAYGLVLFAGANLVFWPVWLSLFGLTLPPAAPFGVALVSHVVYGTLLGVLLNAWGLLRV